MTVELEDLQDDDIVADSTGRVFCAVVTAATANRPAAKTYFHTIGTAARATPADGLLTLLMRDGSPALWNDAVPVDTTDSPSD